MNKEMSIHFFRMLQRYILSPHKTHYLLFVFLTCHIYTWSIILYFLIGYDRFDLLDDYITTIFSDVLDVQIAAISDAASWLCFYLALNDFQQSVIASPHRIAYVLKTSSPMSFLKRFCVCSHIQWFCTVIFLGMKVMFDPFIDPK